MSSTTLRPDLCVIGASEAGRAVAMGAAAMGCAVVVIDDGDPSGRRNPDLVLELLRAGARAGHQPEAVLARLGPRLEQAAADRSHARLAAMNIRVIPATGRFRDPETVEADASTVKARRFVLATGRARPGREGLAIADLASRRPVAILGGGPDTVSAAQSLGRLGTAVTLATEVVLPGIDPELAAPVLAALARQGVTIAATPPSDRPVLAIEQVSALDGLGLDHAGIARRGGRLVLTPALRTTNRRVFAAGHAGGAVSTAAGLSQAGVVLQAALFRLPVRDRPDRVPIVIATDPEIAQVGLTEDAARARGDIRVWRWPLAQTGAGGESLSGHLKVVTDAGDRLLGAGIVGDGARELIGFWTLALVRRLTLGDLAAVAMPVPSWSEAARAVAVSHAAQRLRSPWVGRALGVLRRLG